MAWFICDNCGWKYRYEERKKTSYATIVCPDCFDGAYDKNNHPQNSIKIVGGDPKMLEDARPDISMVSAVYVTAVEGTFNMTVA